MALFNGISIHAPAKGATCAAIISAALSVFQSTLPRRERRSSLLPSCFPLYFNPRSREGSDDIREEERRAERQFQSTLPRRERHRIQKLAVRNVRFQSTLPRRERLSGRSPTAARTDFNPRSREGSDRSALEKRGGYRNFNPRSREGSDAYRRHGSDVFRHFNPRSREGSDLQAFRDGKFTGISIHAPAKGATAEAVGQSLSCQNFNPRSREGSDSAV